MFRDPMTENASLKKNWNLEMNSKTSGGIDESIECNRAFIILKKTRTAK